MENINLSPLFKEFKFGLQKSYSFYNEAQDCNLEQIHESLQTIIKNTFNNEDFSAIGQYDGYLSFYVRKKDIKGAVFCLAVENSSKELTQVADSVEGLYKICSDIKLFWEEHPGKRSLPKTPETVARMKQIMADFKRHSPSAFSRFWQEHAMGSLLIGLEL